MSGGDNTSARAVDIRIAAQLVEMIVAMSGLARSERAIDASQDLEEALALIAKRIKDREAPA